jgi:hypothetical protein
MPVAGAGLAAALGERHRRPTGRVARERLSTIDAESDLLPLVRQRDHIGLALRGIEFHPGREREALGGQQPQARTGRHRDALCTGKLGPAGDQRGGVVLGSRSRGIVLVRGRIQRQAGALIEFEGQRLIDVEGPGDIGGRSGAAVAVIDVDLVSLGPSSQLRHADP